MTIIRTYSELILLPTFRERFDYLVLDGVVGHQTFGANRYLNQNFYRSKEWRRARMETISRDNGCDLGIDGYEIDRSVPIYIHHLNPITKQDILERSIFLLDPEYLITTIFQTHNAIHYGDESLLQNRKPILRTRNDTCPWKRNIL